MPIHENNKTYEAKKRIFSKTLILVKEKLLTEWLKIILKIDKILNTIKTYKGYFYCLSKDYDVDKIKKFLSKKTYYNYFPNFKPNLILLYFNNILVNEFKSERKCAEYLGIKYQNLNYGLRSKGYFKINGFKAVRRSRNENIIKRKIRYTNRRRN